MEYFRQSQILFFTNDNRTLNYFIPWKYGVTFHMW